MAINISMKFELLLENQSGEQRLLDWQLVDHALSAKWVDLMIAGRADNPNSIWDWWGVGYSQEHLDSIWSKIKQIVLHLNSIEQANIDERLLSGITRDNLNELHKQFHLLAEHATDASNEVNQLNYLVHLAESCVQNVKFNSKEGSFTTRFNNYNSVPLTEEDYTLFDRYITLPGELTLGYSTIGKNLLHCYGDNDLRAVKEGLVRPKLTLTTEVRPLLGINKRAGSDIEASNRGNRAKFYKWCEDNGVGEYYDYRSPMHSAGQCVIGHAVTFDPAEINEWAIASTSVKLVNWTIA